MARRWRRIALHVTARPAITPLSHLAAVGTRPRLRRPARAKSRAAVPGARARANGAIQVQRHSVATLAFPQLRQGGRVLNQGPRGAAISAAILGLVLVIPGPRPRTGDHEAF